MHSLWTSTFSQQNSHQDPIINMPEFEALQGDISTNVLIIGGGITGILSAYMLAQANVDYILVEADRICNGVTANTKVNPFVKTFFLKN